MKTIMLSGLSPAVSEDGLRAALEKNFGAVAKIEIVRDGNPDQPLALVYMDIDDEAAFALQQRLSDIWHDGRRINARLMLHGGE